MFKYLYFVLLFPKTCFAKSVLAVWNYSPSCSFFPWFITRNNCYPLLLVIKSQNCLVFHSTTCVSIMCILCVYSVQICLRTFWIICMHNPCISFVLHVCISWESCSHILCINSKHFWYHMGTFVHLFWLHSYALWSYNTILCVNRYISVIQPVCRQCENICVYRW